MKEETKTITRALTSRETLFELIVLAIVLAFGVNLASSNAAEYWGAGSRIVGVTGWILIIAPIVYLLAKLKRSLNSITTVNAVVVVDTQSNKVLDIPGYAFSEKLKKVFNAAFVENEAYQNIWDASPLVAKTSVLPFPVQRQGQESAAPVVYSAVYETTSTNNSNTGSIKLLIEAIEYLLIEEISDQLSESFNRMDEDDSKIKGLTGQEIPSELLSNRFLRLFTTPLEERPIYKKVNLQMLPQGSILRSITGSDGSLFTSLGIYLPQSSSITRPQNGILVLDSTRANITLTVKYTEERQTPPENFVELYIGKNPSNVALLKLIISLKVSVPLLSLGKLEGWRYYQWADGIPNKIHKAFNFPTYVSRINWSQVRTQARVNIMVKRLEERARKKDTKTETQ